MPIRLFVLHLLGSGTMLGSICTMMPAQAQETSDSGIDEIVVVAESRSERLQDIPIAITSLSADQLERAGIESTLQLSSLTPGLNFTSATGSAAPFMRGIGSNTVGPGAESSVATYVDGVYYASVSSTVFSMAGVEQVNVLKGPQGTLFGRNATGGVIQIVTRDPDYAPGGTASISYGNYEILTTKAYVTGGLSDTIAMNLAASYRSQGNGYGRNLTTGDDVNETDSLALRTKLLWQPSDGTKVILAGDYSNLDTSEGIAWRIPYNSLPAVGGMFTGGKQDVDSNVDPFTRSKQGGVSFRVESELGFANLLSITAFRREVQNLRLDSDYSPVPRMTVDGRKAGNQYSQEIQLIGPSGSRVKWVAGLYGFYLDSAYDPLQTVGNLLAPLTLVAIHSRQKVWSGAVFGQVTVDDVLPDTDLTVGGRYTVERRKLAISQSGRIGAFDLGVLAGDMDKESWSSPSWRVALDHRLSPGVLAYLSYNRGFKSGMFNALGLPAEAVKPEKLDAFEGGLKVETADRRLLLNAAVFYYTFRNMQVPRYLSDGVVGGVVLTNAGRARMYGLELEGQFAPTPSLRLTAGASLLNARYRQFEGTPFNEPLPQGGHLITYGSAAGNHIMLSPDMTFNASITYALPGKLKNLEISSDYYYNDGWYATPNNQIRQPSFSQVNARLRYKIPQSNFEIAGWIRNLTNEVYAQYLSNTDTFSNLISVSPPRTYGFTLTASF